MITYNPTINKPNSIPRSPEIKGYQKQFSFYEPRGEVEITTVPDITQPKIVEQDKTEQVTGNNEWSDILSIIRSNEGYIPVAKKMFNEPNPTVGYGFFDVLPDGTKITEGMQLSKAQADKQLSIAIDKLSSRIKTTLDSYNLQVSPEQLNILIDLGYHAGAGTVDKLLRESNGDSIKIGSLLNRYATTAKYGDTSITRGLQARAKRRSEGWNKYTYKASSGLKIPNELYKI